VISDIPAGEKWFGYPAMRGREFLRNLMTLRRWVNEDATARDEDDAAIDDASGQDGRGDDGRRG
jgi:hypothetical protein